MHLAVVAGADEGKKFVTYVNYLADNHFVPPNSAPLLEYMREVGNQKNHEIKLGTKDEVDKIIKFVESLLYFIYELPGEFEASPTDE